jgi:hypothetical protein
MNIIFVVCIAIYLVGIYGSLVLSGVISLNHQKKADSMDYIAALVWPMFLLVVLSTAIIQIIKITLYAIYLKLTEIKFFKIFFKYIAICTIVFKPFELGKKIDKFLQREKKS